MTAPKLPIVSVITPTWQRHDELFDRCIPAVQAQTYPRTEHVIISDGPDPVLSERMASNRTWPPELQRHFIWYWELSVHDPAPHYGHLARRAGLEHAGGELITYCDDDDALRPEHCTLLSATLAARPDCGFALSRMLSHSPSGTSVIGAGTPACGNVGTPMIMHRRDVLEHANWDQAGQFEDWDLVAAWADAGVLYAQADAETSDVWPSAYRGR